jgi:hypothetical protein
MLAPSERELLLDALRPEPGTVLDAAVGTTFTLDLDALLLAPLVFALFDTDGPPDPTALLAAIRQHAARIALYCDAGHIAPPEREQKLFLLLEQTLVPVRAPRGGAFHPKLWVLRFRARDGELRHRVLVPSRNLTFDSSWDLLVRLDQDADGEPLGADVAHALRGLDGLSRSPLATSVAASVENVRFAAPQPFDELRLRLLGTSASAPTADPLGDDPGDRLLVVSPFLSGERLADLERLAPWRQLISRPDELDRIGAAALEQWRVPLILRRAELDAAARREGGSVGLHAKLFVLDRGERSTWIAGSANATVGALRRNVESCVELGGPRAKVGIKRLLKDSDSEVLLRRLLEEYTPSDADPQERSEEELEAERLERVGAELARMDLVARVRSAGVGWAVELHFEGDRPALDPTDVVEARAITRGLWRPLELDGDPAATLDVALTSEITSLIVVRITGALGASRELVLLGRLHDEPADRLDRLLLDLVPDKRRFTLLLFLMLAAGDPDTEPASVARQLVGGAGNGADAEAALGIPLYEALVRTSAREPERLVAIDDLVARLMSSEEGASRLPDGFAQLWESFGPLVAEAR